MRDRPSARPRFPPEVPLADAVANIAAASQLVLGIERSDLTLIARGLADRIHQPRRAGLYPRSMELVDEAGRARSDRRDDLRRRPERARLGFWQDTGKVVEALTAAGRRLGRGPRGRRFSPLGADVAEL